MTLHFMQSGKPYIILGQRPQLSFLTHRHICANKHNTLRKIAKNVNDWNVGLVYFGEFLFIILPCSSVRCHFEIVLVEMKGIYKSKQRFVSQAGN
jgi:hypothetical protein